MGQAGGQRSCRDEEAEIHRLVQLVRREQRVRGKVLCRPSHKIGRIWPRQRRSHRRSVKRCVVHSQKPNQCLAVHIGAESARRRGRSSEMSRRVVVAESPGVSRLLWGSIPGLFRVVGPLKAEAICRGPTLSPRNLQAVDAGWLELPSQGSAS